MFNIMFQPSDRSLFAQMIKYIVNNDRVSSCIINFRNIIMITEYSSTVNYIIFIMTLQAHSTSPRLEESLRTLMSRSNPNNAIQNPSLSLREFMREGNTFY